MDFRKYVNRDDKKAPKEEKMVESDEIAINDTQYYETIDPDTGFRYDIPMLSSLDPEYYYKYINYMKLRERSPETFKKILSWD